jgi:hypothetical protein
MSFSRNTSRANSSLRSRALGAGLALTLASGAVLADGAHRFVFTAYSDSAGGAEILSGRYRVALEELQSHPDYMDLDPSAINTNRCIAYSMTMRPREAHAACDAAVRAALERRNTVPTWLSWTLGSDDECLALAYANRAVMHWMSQEDAAAQKDLTRALELSPHSNFVAQNVAALKVHVTVALASKS